MSDEADNVDVPAPATHDADDEAAPGPSEVQRTSNYAMGSFILALFALWTVGGGVVSVTPNPYRVQILASQLVGAVVPVGAAIIAFWLAARGETEIADSEGRVGGDGYCVAGRAVALLAVGVIVISVLVFLVLPEPEPLRFGF